MQTKTLLIIHYWTHTKNLFLGVDQTLSVNQQIVRVNKTDINFDQNIDQQKTKVQQFKYIKW